MHPLLHRSFRILTRIAADAANRCACIAFFAVLATPVVIGLDKPERPVLAVALGAAIVCGALGGMLWANPALPRPQRREGRSLAAVAVVLVAVTSFWMVDRPFRQTILRVGQLIVDSVSHPNG